MSSLRTSEWSLPVQGQAANQGISSQRWMSLGMHPTLWSHGGSALRQPQGQTQPPRSAFLPHPAVRSAHQHVALPGRHCRGLSWFLSKLRFLLCTFFFFKEFIFREGKEERGRGREISVCGCLLRIPSWGPSSQPRHVPWPGKWTNGPLVRRVALNSLSHTSQGSVMHSDSPILQTWLIGKML